MPRSLFAGLGAAVRRLRAGRRRRDRRVPGDRRLRRVTTRARRRLAARAARRDRLGASTATCPASLVDVLRVLIGLTGAVILLAAATTSISGVGRVAYSLGRHQMLPHAFGTFGRRSTLPPAAILGAAAVSIALVILAAALGKRAALPREPVQLRRPDHLRGRAGRGRPPPLHRARPRAAVQRPAERPDPRAARSRSPRSSASRSCAALWVASIATHDGGADRRPGLARCSAPSSTSSRGSAAARG